MLGVGSALDFLRLVISPLIVGGYVGLIEIRQGALEALGVLGTSGSPLIGLGKEER
jgi:hypothetical protein